MTTQSVQILKINKSQRSTTSMNMTSNSHLIQEAMSRARMLKPQDFHSEASRPARRIAMRARNEQNRSLGN
jgi:hypothetical protein